MTATTGGAPPDDAEEDDPPADAELELDASDALAPPAEDEPMPDVPLAEEAGGLEVAGCKEVPPIMELEGSTPGLELLRDSALDATEEVPPAEPMPPADEVALPIDVAALVAGVPDDVPLSHRDAPPLPQFWLPSGWEVQPATSATPQIHHPRRLRVCMGGA